MTRALRPEDVYPWEIVQLALGMSSAVRLDHAYLPNDFTLCSYKTPPWNPE
jgi:hypothetical protein